LKQKYSVANEEEVAISSKLELQRENKDNPKLQKKLMGIQHSLGLKKGKNWGIGGGLLLFTWIMIGYFAVVVEVVHMVAKEDVLYGYEGTANWLCGSRFKSHVTF